MGRPKKIGVDWIKLDVHDGKTFLILERRWGNDGFAFWVKLLRLLGRSEGLSFCIDETTEDCFFALMGVDNNVGYDILDTLFKLGNLDVDLWRTKRILYCAGLEERLEPLLGEREKSAERVSKHRNHCNGIVSVTSAENNVTSIKNSVTSAGNGVTSTQSRGDKTTESQNQNNAPAGARNDETVNAVSKTVRQKTLLTAAQQEQFEKFWTAYPKKVSKGQAMSVWKKVNPDGTLTETIIAGVQRAVLGDSRFRDSQFTPYPATWLNSAGWTDEHTHPQSDGATPGREMLEKLNKILTKQKERAKNGKQ